MEQEVGDDLNICVKPRIRSRENQYKEEEPFFKITSSETFSLSEQKF